MASILETIGSMLITGMNGKWCPKIHSFLSCIAIAMHALAEGLALGVAAPNAYGPGQHMVLPVSLHGLPRGAAVASCIFGSTDSWHGAMSATALIGIVGPLSAIGAILAGIDYTGLDHLMVFCCGCLLPCFLNLFRRAARLDSKKSTMGVIIGVGFASVCLTCTKLVCLHTPYCNSAPEAVRYDWSSSGAYLNAFFNCFISLNRSNFGC